MNIKTGDFIVTINRWRVEVHEAIKVSSKLVFYLDEHWGRQARVRLDDIVFSGEQSPAKRLAAQLTSSQAQEADEQRAVSERRAKRDAKFIAAASEQQDAPIAGKSGEQT